MQAKLDFLHYYSFAAKSYVGFHKHSCFELVYYSKGTGRMKLGDEQYYYSPHSLLLTEPEFYHDEEHYEATDVLYIGFTYDDTTVPLKNGLFFDDSSHLLLHLLERMKQVMIAQRPHYILQLNLLAGEIIIELSRLKYSAAKPKLWENKLIYAVKAIEENYIHPIDLHSLASLSGYSFERFRHIFKEETGYSPVQYIMSKRFAHAKQMLEASATPISLIASESGFSTVSQFCKLFKERFGCTPLEYRKQQG
ncbi:MAG: helix-turn-helix domain-containing protein [Paenibacillaceae bacterium]|nr:helix-turn-helix domain-containing protein [Paenibacillaceae bacterium]